MARLKGVLGVDLEPLYDQLILPSAGMVNEYGFFAIGKGNTDPGSTGSTYTKSLVDTNQTQPNRLNKPEEFDILGVALIPEFNSTLADVVKIMNKSVFEITGSGTSVQFRSPTRAVTQGCGLTRTDSAGAANGTPQPQAIISFPLEHAIEVKEGEQYGARLLFPVTQTFTADIRVMCILWGLHKKAVGKVS